MFGPLKIRQKFGLVTLVAVISAAALGYEIIRSAEGQIEFTRRELAGSDYLDAARRLLVHVAEHRAAVNAVANGDPTYREQAMRAAESIEADLRSLTSIDGRAGAREAGKEIVAAWAALRPRAFTQAPLQGFEEHSRLTALIAEAFRKAGENSNLSVDPDLDTNQLADGLVSALPAAIEAAAQLGAYAGGIAVRARPAAPDEAAHIAGLARVATVLQEAAHRHMQKTIRRSPALEAKLADPLGQANESFQRLHQSAGRGVLITGRTLYDVNAQALKDQSHLFEAANSELRELLEKRIVKIEEARNIHVGATAAAAILLAGLLFGLSRGITAQVNAMTRTLTLADGGDAGARCDVLSRDELGKAASGLNTILAGREALMESREERDQMQARIRKLLAEVSPAARGDLSRDADVSDEVTGPIAESFNRVTAALRQMVALAQRTAQEMSRTASVAKRNAESSTAQCAEQSAQILEASRTGTTMVASFQEIARTAARAAQAAEETLAGAQQGAEMATRAIEGMNAIRAQVQEAATRIRTVEDSTQEIGETVQLIRDIAERTSLLALNASIQAAKAGDAGKGFAAVAEEIERLADRAGKSTRRIASLIQSVQRETHEAASAMEETTRAAAGGAQWTGAAGQKLARIEQPSREIAGLAGVISASAEGQASRAEQMVQEMADLSRVSLEAAEQTRQTAAATGKLAALAEELSESVSRFQLPAGKVAA